MLVKTVAEVVISGMHWYAEARIRSNFDIKLAEAAALES